MLRAALTGALLLGFAAPAIAGALCVDVSVPKGAIVEKNGRWAEVAPEQYRFLQGIYAMNPATPPGLPYGDRAVLATVPEHDGGLVFFIDGDLACTPMPVPRELVDMLRDVAGGAVTHEGISN